MLPATKDGKELYGSVREVRNRWRAWAEFECPQTPEAKRNMEMTHLELDCELSSLREVVDFMTEENMLTPEQIEAANNIFGWADVLRSSLEVK